MINVYLNKDKCIGCGRCVDICPDMFRISGKTSSVLEQDAEPNKAERFQDLIKLALLCCPAGTIDMR